METTHETQGTRAILADADPTVRRALRALMTQALEMNVVAESDTTADLQGQVRAHRPDIVVVAWNLVASNAEAALATMRSSSPGLRIVALALRPETRQVALTAGADDFISKIDTPDRVARVLQRCDERSERTDAAGAIPGMGSDGRQADQRGGRR
jgi:DNA-binding NarL/FixJ family response regulator